MEVGERDAVTGRFTTGHEWNGIKELDTPIPRIVIFFLIATTLFAIGYWILMPAWPLGWSYTKGLLGIDQRTTVAEKIEQAKADEATKLADEVANLINNEESRGATTGAGGEPTLGREDGRSATLSQSEIGALVAQIRACITLPAGAKDADARAEFTFSIGADGMVSGRPQMMSTPNSQIEDAYARAVSRALQRCGPFTVAAGQDVRAQFAAREF